MLYLIRITLDMVDMVDRSTKTATHGGFCVDRMAAQSTCDPGPDATRAVDVVPKRTADANDAHILDDAHATHIAHHRGSFWSWTGSGWRPAMRFEANLARDLKRRNRDRSAPAQR